MPASVFSFTANGEAQTRPVGTTLPEFLASVGLSPERVVVERNRQALTPAEVRATVLAEGDRLEVVRLYAGG